jgi:hypothetical protein
MYYSKVPITAIAGLVYMAFTALPSLAEEEGSLNPLYAPSAPLSLGLNSIPGNELVDIVFVIDGSGSIYSSTFLLQKEGIKNASQVPMHSFPPTGRWRLPLYNFQRMPTLRYH